MSKFKLFDYLRWKNDKTIRITNSSYKKYYDLYNQIYVFYPWLQKYNLITDSFSLIKSVVILEALNNKNKIETDSQLYNESDLLKKSTYDVIHNRLPSFKFNNIEIYVPFFQEMYCEHYDTKLTSLIKLPYITLKDDFEMQTINPFDYYGIKLFDSPFTKLIKFSEYENSTAFYDIELETIYVIDDQGCLDQDIPIFENSMIDKKKEHLFDKLSVLMKFYFENNRDGFVDCLNNFGFISRKTYDFIIKSINRREKNK